MEVLTKLGCRRRLEHWHEWDPLNVGRGDAFKMRSNASKFGIYKSIDKSEVAIEPCEQAIVDLIMNRQRDLGAARTDRGEINKSHDVDVSADGFERELFRAIAVGRQEDRTGFEAERTAEAEFHGFGRGHGRLCDHDELAFVRLNAGQASLGFGQRLTHMKRFFKEHSIGLVVASIL